MGNEAPETLRANSELVRNSVFHEIDKHLSIISDTAAALVDTKAYPEDRVTDAAPPVMVWHLKHNRALHERLFVLTVQTEAVPWIDDAARLRVEEIAPRFWRATARYGFMKRPDIPALLQTAHAGGCGVDLSDVT